MIGPVEEPIKKSRENVAVMPANDLAVILMALFPSLRLRVDENTLLLDVVNLLPTSPPSTVTLRIEASLAKPRENKAGDESTTDRFAGVLFASTGGLLSMVMRFEKSGLMNTPSSFFALISRRYSPSGISDEKRSRVDDCSAVLNEGMKRSPVDGFLSWAKVMVAGSRNCTVAEEMLPA